MKTLALLGALTVSLASVPASAATITTLYNTGVDAAGTVQGNGAFDSHYTLNGSTPRVATSANGFPIPPWLGDNSTSAWIGPVGSSDLTGPVGNATYRTTFSLAGFNAATASIAGRWATDDQGIDIFLNGVSQGLTANGFQSFTSFSITSGFTAGLNTLDFVVFNGGGPTGLRTELAGTAAAAVPEPATWGMMILGFGVVGAAMRRRKAKVATTVRFA